MSFTNIFRGARGLSQPPIDDIESYWTPMEKAQAMRMLARSIVGSPDTVRTGMAALIEETGADELMVVSDVYEHAERLRSFELIAEAAESWKGLVAPAFDGGAQDGCAIRSAAAAIKSKTLWPRLLASS